MVASWGRFLSPSTLHCVVSSGGHYYIGNSLGVRAPEIACLPWFPPCGAASF